MDFQQLAIFCTLLSEKNMTATAHRLKMTQPTVSRQLKLLESELGVDLLDRETREIQPTIQGQILFDYAQKILNLEQKFKTSIQSLSYDLQGSLRITTLNYLGMSLLSPIIWNVFKPNNKFKIKISYAPAKEAIELMKNKEVDVAILPSLKEEMNIDLPEYDHRFLFQDSMLLVGSAKDTSLPKKIKIQDISQKPLVSFGNMFPQFNKYLSQNVNLDPILDVNNLGTLKKVIEKGHYWGFLPRMSIKKQIQFHRLSEVKVEGIEYPINIQAYFLKNSHNQKVIEILISILKNHSSILKI